MIKNALKNIRAFPSKMLWRVVDRLVARRQAALLYYTQQDQKNILAIVRTIRAETKMLLWEPEAYQIYTLVQSLKHISGDIAEVGTYRGGSAKLIALADPHKDIHTFDTFEGLPDVDGNIDAARFSTGQYATAEESVRNYLAVYPNIHIYKGFFPASSAPVVQKKFSFVHLDVDIYQSTKDSLAFFYPRMVSGAVILSHDYSTAQGVRQAFNEFFSDKPEVVIELMSSQCLVIKQ